MMRQPIRNQAAAVRFVPVTSAHADLFWRSRREASMRRFNPVELVSPEETARRLASAGHDLRDESYTDYRWLIEIDGVLAGQCSVRPNWRMRFAELGYQIFEEHQGQGFGLAAVRALVDKAFADSATLDRLIAIIAENNAASRRIVERIGFAQEGVLREHYIIEGRRVNEVVYGLLRSEWESTSAT